ncbi:MAG: membrane protein insertion efficiency factor YidD [Ignavibacteriales bacterium]
MTRVAIFLIKTYQILSQNTLPSCRYMPTCSTYAIQALEKYGFFKGLWLALCRIARCHPFHAGGYDPVP